MYIAYLVLPQLAVHVSVNRPTNWVLSKVFLDFLCVEC